MPPILSIETATSVCSVALHDKGNLIASSELHIEKIHAAALTPTIDFLLKQCEISWHELAAVAVSKGPGSYTGLRIGTAVAKGLSFTLNIPLISVEPLEAMAQSLIPFMQRDAPYICPMIDARRMEVYYALFNDTGARLTPTAATIVDTTFLRNLVTNHSVVFCGNGVAKCKSILQSFQNAYTIDSVYPLAKWIGEIAVVKLAQNQFENPNEFEPFYLKEFVKLSK